MSKIDPNEYDLSEEEAEKSLKRAKRKKERKSGSSGKSSSSKSKKSSDDGSNIDALIVIGGTLLFLGWAASKVIDAVLGLL